MSQNRNKLIDLFIGNLSNAILHRILEKAIKHEEIARKYQKEMRNSWEIAKAYREKINPPISFPVKDLEYVKDKLIKRVSAELAIRISKGYQNLSLESVEIEVENALKEMKVV